MRQIRMRPFLVLAAIAAVALAGITAIAAAAKKLKTASETITIGVEQNGSAEAKCKKGTKAISGGFEAEFDPVPGLRPFTMSNESRRSGRRTWSYAGGNEGDASGAATAFAYCRDARLETVASDSVTLAPTDFVRVSARCPRGTKAISGGYRAAPIDFDAPVTPVIFITESRRSDDKRAWDVAAASVGNDDGDLTAHAVCSAKGKLKAKQASATLSDQPGESFREIDARCKRKQRVVSGGWTMTTDNAEAAPVIMASKKLGKRGWRVTAPLGGTGIPVDVTAYAYCEKK
jgi:hypothetical protein